MTTHCVDCNQTGRTCQMESKKANDKGNELEKRGSTTKERQKIRWSLCCVFCFCRLLRRERKCCVRPFFSNLAKKYSSKGISSCFFLLSLLKNTNEREGSREHPPFPPRLFLKKISCKPSLPGFKKREITSIWHVSRRG